MNEEKSFQGLLLGLANIVVYRFAIDSNAGHFDRRIYRRGRG